MKKFPVEIIFSIFLLSLCLTVFLLSKQFISKLPLAQFPSPTPTQTQTPIPTSAPTETPRSGIFNGGRDAFPSSTFAVHNMWQGYVGKAWKLIYAGGTPKEPGSVDITPVNGAIWMFIGSIGKNLEKFPAPSGNGPLTIIAVNGSDMQLRTDTGNTLTFDLQTNQYK